MAHYKGTRHLLFGAFGRIRSRLRNFRLAVFDGFRDLRLRLRVRVSGHVCSSKAPLVSGSYFLHACINLGRSSLFFLGSLGRRSRAPRFMLQAVPDWLSPDAASTPGLTRRRSWRSVQPCGETEIWRGVCVCACALGVHTQVYVYV